MAASISYPIKANFREDPHLMAVLRRAIALNGFRFPDLSDEQFEFLMDRYREKHGEKNHGATFSVAKHQLDRHLAQFKSKFTSNLASCLYSQLDRVQGREDHWPALESASPDLVPDAVIERRMAIDNLTRLINLDADEGVKAFDVLLGKALGRASSTLRDNPLRPAVFFHALGLSWTQAAGDAEDELVILDIFGSSLAKRVGDVYPSLTAILREALGIAKPGNTMFAPGSDNTEEPGKLYSRLRQDAMVINNPTTLAEEKAVRSEELARDAVLKPLMDVVAQLDALYEPALQDKAIPKSIRLMLAGTQMPVIRIALKDPAALASADKPLRMLLTEFLDTTIWPRCGHQSSFANAYLMQLGLVAEMLKRNAQDSARDRLLYEHLRQQLQQIKRDALTPPAKLTTYCATP